VLTNGEFIEKEVMGGTEPVLFTGKENVPDQIAEYLRNSDIEVGVLIGSDLIGAATNIRRTTGINVIVKFARGARIPGSAISPVEGLDLFYLPIPDLNLTVRSLKYNRATNQLEVTYKSESNVPIYFRGTLSYENADGERDRVGDALPVFIAPNEYKTLAYSDVRLPENPTTVDLLTLYGETPAALEKILQAKLIVEVVNVIDRCSLEVTRLKYSRSKNSFYVYVKNKAEVDCWSNAELIDVKIDGNPTTISSGAPLKVLAGKTKRLSIKQEMTDQDLLDNEEIMVRAYYGERQDNLVRVFQGKFKLLIETISLITIILIILIIIVIILIFIILLRRRRKDEEDDW
jgi:hypothetical protein